MFIDVALSPGPDGAPEIAGAMGTSSFVRPTGTKRLMMQERYRAGRFAAYSTVRIDRGLPDAAAIALFTRLPLATIWYSAGTVSRSVAVA